ncbi:ABC-type dipeptide/oligopeptide/nickel transport system permease subunit [Neorhizobium huautlense]|uniref:ABC-type dipeptide/oligopeptide/nickel transport system permease subunit n=1 Tax=Neorhizobium huautlense TaxID=67774 RepID=A0ABT9PMC1_9HYPH|nr:ABC transporter permease [Neorhizobium huautlense]MDP9835308.1 ABC-type dipeptide/oligopeptide/nickel transport system permease subunit [Neorhizobium huautlense]
MSAVVSNEKAATVATSEAPANQAWWRRFLRDPAALIAITIFSLICLAAIFAPLLAPHDPYASSRRTMLPPFWAARGSVEYLLGTDPQGRDILSRLLYGTRLTLLIGLASVAIGGVLGSFLGLLAAFYRSLDPWIMRLSDILLSLPAILLGLALVAAMGQGATPIMLALIISTIPDCARVARGIGLGIMGQEFITAGRSLGIRDPQLFSRYLVLNCISSVLIFLSLRFGQLILIAASLSFLGLGARPPVAELGMMAAQGRDFFLFAPHIAVIPSVLILVIVMAANVIGDTLRDVLDPRLKT